MRALIQRVSRAAVTIDHAEKKAIGAGLLVFLGIEESDGPEDISWLSGKIARLRIFDDVRGVMNVSLQDSGGDLMIISQFTLHASTRKGNRPSYIRAARPETAIPLYEEFIRKTEGVLDRSIVTGKFGANMQVELVNDGPVTISIDTKNRE